MTPVLHVARRAAKLREDLVSMLVDSGLVALSLGGSLLVVDIAPATHHGQVSVLKTLPIAVALVLTANKLAGLYDQVWRHASVVEATRLVQAAVTAFALLYVVNLVTGFLAWQVLLVASMLYIGAAGLVRFQARLVSARRGGARRPGVTRVLLVGSGEAAAALLRDIDRQGSDLQAVALVDDNPRMHGRRLRGVPVMGAIDDLPAVAARARVDQVLLAIPSASQDLVRRVADLTEAARLPLRLLPPVSELAGGRVGLRDVRDVDIRDLLGRSQIETDLDAVRALVVGKVVLVTGAGGSIGSEISRQVASFGPRELLLLDHDETHLFDVAATLPPTATQVLADIRDRARINAIFGRHKPDVVFHAAAHKHVPLLEAHPAEAIRTNITGTDAVVQAAVASGTQRFVFISTDKAVEPSSIMGASKRVAEQLVLARRPLGTAFCAVRFGNVLGSRGSVIPTFLEQIRRGGPVTVTDARMTRYFMSIPEAVQLVLQAAALSTGGEIFMLDMGESVNIRDLAERLIRLSGLRPGVDIEIRVTGIRPGEKLHETLHAVEEAPQATAHPAVLRLSPSALPAPLLNRAVASLMVLTDHGRTSEARELLVDLAHGNGQHHEPGLLTLAHRRRAEDHGFPAPPAHPGLPRRRLTDVIALPQSRDSLPEPTVTQLPEPSPAWTSSTT